MMGLIYIDYVNSVNNVVAELGAENGDGFKESQRIFGKIKEKFRDPVVTMLVDMANSKANRLNGDVIEANKLLLKAESDNVLLESQGVCH